MIYPIWQDRYANFLTEESPVNYSINTKVLEVNKDTGLASYVNKAIFYGKAWAAPAYTDENFQVNLNKICEDYLTNEIGDFNTIKGGEYITHTDAVKTFIIRDEDKNSIVKTVTFIYDWSHDNSKTYTEGKVTDMSDPINRKGVDGMYYFKTEFDGTEVKTLVSVMPINGYTETTDCNAGKWALYYLNRYGGWDSYLIDGYVSKKDNFVRKNVVKSFNNNTLEYGNKPYMTQITPNYEIHTGWMNDRESEVLAANVFQSTRVYLHNLETDEVIPIVITDADVLHKNHKNSGRRLLNYTINAVSAQTEYNKN